MRLAEQLKNMAMLNTNEVFKNLTTVCETAMVNKTREGKKRNILVEIKEENFILQDILIDDTGILNLNTIGYINSSTIATMFDNWLRNEGFTNYEWTKNMFKVYW